MGHPSFWWCRQSTWILRWEPLALPRTPLPQDDGVLEGECGDSTTHPKVSRGLLRSSFQIVILNGGTDSRASSLPQSKDPEVAGVCSCFREGFPPRTRSEQSSCRELPSISCRVPADAGSLDSVRSSASGRFSPLGMTECRRVQKHARSRPSAVEFLGSHLSQRARKMGQPSFMVVSAKYIDPSLGVLGFATDSAVSG
jgi:hypothetical protein